MSSPFVKPDFHTLRVGVERLRGHSALVVGFGVVAVVLGLACLALVELATVSSVLFVGAAMAVFGAVEIGIGFRTKTWGRLVLFELAGLFYLLAGGLVVADPLFASSVLTLILGAGLVATGIVRLVAAFRLGAAPMRAGLIVSGLITTLLGMIIVTGWPANSLFVLGMLLGIDLVFYGLGWVAFGVRLRQRP